MNANHEKFSLLYVRLNLAKLINVTKPKGHIRRTSTCMEYLRYRINSGLEINFSPPNLSLCSPILVYIHNHKCQYLRPLDEYILSGCVLMCI